MIPKKIAIYGLVLLCFIQIYVAARMIYAYENVLTTGTSFKLRIAPVDPTDPFRGKYITLRFRDNTLKVAKASDWPQGSRAYVTFVEDSLGFARADDIFAQPLPGREDYLEIMIENIIDHPDEQLVYLAFPFDRFYLEESRAAEAERLYQEALASGMTEAYAHILVKNGHGTLADVIVGDKSVKNLGSPD
ncbi:MAG: GDYXXLXY domain-containing protein [Saprospiraceae bacterium]|nr:GDYXXLXY domain-containing protein [Saprospiraceae bacterium]